MNETWWVNIDQLDDKQREILIEPPESELLIVGPPGSGKTNILMLRANYVRYVGPRILFLTFTRSLAEFLRSGASVGRADQIQRTDIKTFMGWARGIILEHGGAPPDDSGDFEADRRAMVAALKEVVDGQHLGQLYDFAFVDEVQDFWESELMLVRRLAAKINVAGDLRQRIWSHREGLATAKRLVTKTVELDMHYRIGEAICRFADQILPPTEGAAALLEGCNYNEEARPSSVKPILCENSIDMFAACLAAIKEQIRYITDEPIGVLAWGNSVLDSFWTALQSDGDLVSIAIRQRQSEYQPFTPDSRIRVMTIHSAKGSEFRAVHLLLAESFTTKNRELAFTGVTRAKTEVLLYHVAALQGHMVPSQSKLPTNLSSIF